MRLGGVKLDGVRLDGERLDRNFVSRLGGECFIDNGRVTGLYQSEGVRHPQKNISIRNIGNIKKIGKTI